MMLKRRKAPKAGIREEPQIRCPGHLAWVRGHECASATPNCSGKIEAAHVRIGTDGGLGVKPGDNFVVPLCSYHHQCQHVQGEKTFWGQQHIDPLAIANGLWQKSPHRLKWEGKRNV